MAMRKTILLVCLALLATSSTALAQRWGRGGLPREGACFYNDTNFRGISASGLVTISIRSRAGRAIAFLP